LLEAGVSSIAAIIAKTGLKRGITYASLYALEKLGLVRKFEKDKRLFLSLFPRKNFPKSMNQKVKRLN